MISHAVLGTADVDRALRFDRAVLPVLGARERSCERSRPWAGWEPATGGRPLLLLAAPIDGGPHAAGDGQTVALAAPDRASVERAHAAALAHGGTCKVPPADLRRRTNGARPRSGGEPVARLSRRRPRVDRPRVCTRGVGRRPRAVASGACRGAAVAARQWAPSDVARCQGCQR